ncbi:MAG: TolC family protein [Ignavibacteriae bacterium]|nr:MAG: TolC family protein [Ignavibacteriota bacterium]
MKLLGFLVLIFFNISISAAQDSLTVEQAVQRVLQIHPAIEQALANTRAAEARVSQAASVQLPDVSTEAAYTHIGPVPAFFFGGQNLVLAPADNYDAHIIGRYTVYDFGKTNSAVDMSRSKVQASRDMVDLTKSNLELQTIRTFYTIVLLRKSLLVQDEQIAALNEHLAITQKRVAAGSATNFDVLTTQVRVAASQNQRVEILNSLQKQESIFRQLLGLPANTPVLIRGSFEQTSIALNIDSLQRTAIEQRPELKLARDAEQSAQLQKKFSSLGNMPVLNVNLAYGVKNGYEPNIYALRGNWMWGVQARVPLFDGGRVSHQEEEAQASLQAEQAHGRDVERQVRSDVEQVAADVQAALDKVKISEVQLRQAMEAVSIARTRYETGSITNLDLLDAETAESASKLTNLQALYRLMLNKYELDRATGKPFDY